MFGRRRRRNAIRKADQWASSALSPQRRNVGHVALDQALVGLDRRSAGALPWMAAGSVMNQLGQGMLERGPDELRAAGLLGSCSEALLSCAGNPAISAADFTQPDTSETRRFFAELAAGANQLGRSPDGQPILTMKMMPAALDGLARYREQPQQLAHHTVTWFLLMLASGTGDAPIPENHRAAVAAILSPPG